jgi:formate hydrogenlyase subunit 6/NADH:ubiquinone oxidoreductase subunit I
MLSDVFASLFRRPFTERYPFAVRPAPARLRGKLLWDQGKCRGCMLCVRDCPAQAIEVEVVDRAAKRYAFRYYLDRCIYCAQCVSSCRDGALSMSSDLYHLAAPDKSGFVETYRPLGGACAEDPEKPE